MCLPKKNLGFIIVFALLGACSTKTTEVSDEEAAVEYMSGEKTAICLGNNVSVRKTPATTGDLLTAVSIGESVAYLDSVVVDTVSKGKYEYALIRLSDGTEGWAVKTYLFEEAQLITITERATIYSRPDLLTGTKKSFELMDLVVITSGDQEAQEENWLPITGRIRGSKSFSSGWIKGINTTTEPQDVLVAQLVYKANELKDPKKMEELNSILSNEAYSNSIFINSIRALTYNDPNGLLKEEYERYYVGMINYYDSVDHDYYWRFDDDGPSVDIFGKTFHSYRVSEVCDYCDYSFIWFLFYDFTTFLADDKGYESTSQYGNYFELEDKLSAMEELAGMPVYNRIADHNGDFDQVNSDFVMWVANKLIPHPDNDFLGMSAQKVYDVVFRANARDTWYQWRILNYHFDLEEVAGSYEDGMSYGDFQGYEFLKSRFRNTNVNPILAGTFIRRKIDGSYDAIIHTMLKTMALYDSEWIAKQLEEEPYLEENYNEEDYYEVEEEG